MAIQIYETNEKVKHIASCARDFGLLIGGVDDITYVPGFHTKPGLGMETESKGFAELAEDLNEGVFKILVMGKFKNGKSTLINSILGKPIMAARTTATTAVIAIVRYGEHDNVVRVYKSDCTVPEIITLDEFTEKFALTEEDQKLIEDSGGCDRFFDVSYVVMESCSDLFRNGIQLIDSPGLEEAISRTKTTNEFAPKANAVIFTLSGTSLFSEAERKYIKENFVGKQLRNVFFVINRIDQIHQGQLETNVMPVVRNVLCDVFFDKNGLFDEELYSKRVFFTNAYGALCVRTGNKYTVNIGNKAIPVDINIEDTGIPAFESALTEFLNSDDRLIATFQSTLTAMANTYLNAKLQVQSDLAARQMPLEQLEKKLAESQEILDDLRIQADSMSHLIKNSGNVIAQKIYNSLLAYVQTDIPREFAAEIDKNETKFGVSNMLKLAASAITTNLPGKDKKQTKEDQALLLKPITDKIEDYIRLKLEIWEKRAMVEVSPDINDLEKELGNKIHKFDIGMDKVISVFSQGNALQDETYVASPLQTVFALSHGDISLAIEGAASGGMAWSDYLKRTLLQMLINWGISALFGSAILIPALLVEAAGLIVSTNRLPKQLLKSIAPAAFERLRERICDEETNLVDNIESQFGTQSADLLSKANGLVDDAEKKQNSILTERTMSEELSQAEAKRQNAVIDALKSRFSDVYRILYNKAPDDNDIIKFAKRKVGISA